MLTRPDGQLIHVDQWADANPYTTLGRAEALRMLGDVSDTIGWLPVEVVAYLRAVIHHPADPDRRLLHTLRHIDGEVRS